MSQTENYTFKTEDKRLLDLVINSLYSEKEIFLRELISNAADAINKIKFEAISNPALIESDSQYEIGVKIDKDLKALIITDNGIGMDKEELIKNLGTIAHSGSFEFNQEQKGQKEDIIGQFGVGFYSVFMAASSVEVYSTRAGGHETYLFKSDGTGEFSIEKVPTLARGTKIIIHLKEEQFLDLYTVRSVIEKYSQYTALPIYLEHWVEPTPKNEEKTPLEDSDQAKKESEAQEDAADQGSYQKEQINDHQPLWLTSKDNLSEEQYKEFYKAHSRDFRDPLSWIHNKVEGQSTYSYVLFIPAEKPFSFLQQEKPKGCKLHVKRVFITDDSEKLLPNYLGFVSGVVDFQDLPLNVSRELLQENRVIARTKKALTKKVLSHLSSMAKNSPQDYEKFWNQFGQMLKLFPNEDHDNKETIIPLLRFRSTIDQAMTSIDAYIERMDKESKKIYYIAAPTLDAALHSPHMDYFKEKNIEVLLLLDKIDESLLSYLSTYQDKQFISITSSDIEDQTSEEKDSEEKKEEKSDLCQSLEKILEGKIKEVKVSKRLTTSPACLVVQGGATMYMQRLMQEAGQNFPTSLPTMEINLDHSLVKKMQGKDQAYIEKWGQILYSLAMLAEGGNLQDPATFAKQMTEILEKTPETA